MQGTLTFIFSQEVAIMCTFAGVEILKVLYCGACLEVCIGGFWFPTRIEKNNNVWELVGLRGVKLADLPVRI